MLPLPKAIRAMTAAVPMMMPSTESMDRSLCSHRLRRARMKLLRHLTQSTATRAENEPNMDAEPFCGVILGSEPEA